ATQLARCRQLLGVPEVEPAVERTWLDRLREWTGHDLSCCPHCQRPLTRQPLETMSARLGNDTVIACEEIFIEGRACDSCRICDLAAYALGRMMNNRRVFEPWSSKWSRDRQIRALKSLSTTHLLRKTGA